MAPRRAKSQSVSEGAVAKPPPAASPKPVAKSPKSSHSRNSSLSNRSSPLATRTSIVATPPPSTMPSPLRFGLVVLLSMSLNALLFSLTSNYTAGDLAAVSKHLETWPEVTSVVGWKVLELSVFWFSGLDAFDTCALALLRAYPSHVLLQYFYNLRPTTIMLSVLINVFSTTFPFVLLRPNDPVHSFDSAKQKLVPRLTRSIISDPATTLSTSLLASAIVAVFLELSFATYLPRFLILHFEGLRTLEPAYRGAAGLPLMLVHLLPLGLAAREFLFVSSTAITTTSSAEKHYSFDPAKASLSETFLHNVWGWYSSRERALIKRTAIVVGMAGIETAVQVWGTVKGADAEGAVGYAGVWAVALAIVGLVFGWVGEPSGQ